MENKFILDACCGGRQFWTDKQHPNAIYIDIRREDQPLKIRPNFTVQPDKIMDFRDMDFSDKSFKLVIWDPPHLKTLGINSIMRKKYGGLNPETWPSDLKRGFSECWRVLDDYGTMVLKWCAEEIPLKKVLALFPEQPLIVHISGNKNKTCWCCFLKIPKEEGIPPKAKALGILPTEL